MEVTTIKTLGELKQFCWHLICEKTYFRQKMLLSLICRRDLQRAHHPASIQLFEQIPDQIAGNRVQ